MAVSTLERITSLARQHGVLRARDLDRERIPRAYLREAAEQGAILRVGRGLYIAADSDLTEHHSLAEASKRVPHGIICLLSALRLHDLTTQNPHEVWMAIGEKARRPHTEYPPLRIVRFSRKALDYGTITRRIEGVEVRVTTPAKTVADCFKYRNKIGLDVAIEALRDCWKKRRATMDEIWEAAKLCRVTSVIRPYLESIV